VPVADVAEAPITEARPESTLESAELPAGVEAIEAGPTEFSEYEIIGSKPREAEADESGTDELETLEPGTDEADEADIRLPGIVEHFAAPHVIAELGGEPTGLLDLEDAEAEDAEADAAAEDASETAASPAEVRERRSRRNRRGGRSRRSEPRGETADTPPVAAVAEAVEMPVAIVEAPPIDLSVGAHLITAGGMPTIHINGVAYPPVLFFGNMEGGKNTQRVLSEVRQAARSGVHLHSTLIELPCPLSEASHVLDEVDMRLRALADADPEGYLMPRVVFLPARGWKREYPTEISVYTDGTTGDPALTSARFWQECERSLEALIAHINDQIWGQRVFGYHLERGEWFQPADLGFDRSMANRDAFRDWLREKYNHDLVALRAAWYDGDVQFHTAEIPTPPAKPVAQRAFYETRRERALIDFNEFTSESTARRLISLAHVVKHATDRNALASVCYGYTFEFGHGFSGHLALDLLLAESSVDLICGPPSYRDRKVGGPASYPAPIASPPLHGKLWLSEDDTKTYLAPTQQDPADFNPRMPDRIATEQAQTRAIGKALVHGVAVDWMDLWGEGWLDEESMWERIGAFRRNAVARARDRAIPEVIALIDEKSLLHIQKGELFFRRMTNSLHDTLQRAGVSYETYLQSDLLSPNFPTGAKLYLFLTPFRLTAAQRVAIKEKLQRDNQTLAWLYAPGACEERPSIGSMMDETATGVVGMRLRQQPWNSEIGSRVIETNHPLTDRLHGRELGARERLNPSFYVDDPAATILAEYQTSGLASLAVKNMGDWRSVFVGDPVLPLELLRGICRYAGVHLWTGGGEDVVEVGDGWVLLHAARDGQRTLRLREPSALYDMTERRLIADEARDYRFALRTGYSRLFYVGTTERMRELGLPNVPEAGRERVVLPELPVEGERVTAPVAAPSPVKIPLPEISMTTSNPDLETLRAVLAMEIPDTVADLEEEEEEILNMTLPRPGPSALAVLEETLSIEEPTGNARRRRRRGGRGRGRRRPEPGEPVTTEAGEAPASSEAPQAADSQESDA
jgi:hypothetical protein